MPVIASHQIGTGTQHELVQDVQINWYKNETLIQSWLPEVSHFQDTINFYLDENQDTVYNIKKSFAYLLDLNEPIGNTTESYRIEVAASGFETVDAIHAIPKPTNIVNATIERNPTTDKIQVTINDDATEENYYLFNFNGIFETPTDTIKEIATFSPLEGGYILGGGYLTNDLSFNGEQRILEFQNLYLNGTDVPTKIELIVMSASKAHFSFYQSLADYTDANDSPFEEPSVLFSNVNNGFGMFSITHPTIFVLE